MQLRGVFSAVATPFTSEEDLDEDRFRSLIDETIDGGIHGLVPNGSTGEFQTQTFAERQKVAEIADPEAAVGLTVVQVGGGSTTRLAHALRPIDGEVVTIDSADAVVASFIHLAAGGLHG